MLSRTDVETAKNVIQMDDLIDKGYKHLVQAVLKQEDRRVGGAGAAMTVINLAKALERIGDHCTNIAEDIIFLQTGDIIRHAEAFGTKKSEQE
jgi:phosphate transport system protein